MRAAGLAIALMMAGAAAAQPAAPATRYDAQIAEAKAMMMADPAKALLHARQAARLAGEIAKPGGSVLAEAEAHWLEGEALTRVNKPDLAKPVIAGALAQVIRVARGSKLHGDVLMSAAAIDWMTGQVREALIGFQSAYTIYAALGEARAQAKALQYIGTIYFDARDYPRMLRYYKQSEDVYRGDPSLTISALNNQGDALKEMKRFPEAIEHYRRALTLARQLGSPMLEVRILTNLASAQFQAGDHKAADAIADRALRRAAGQDTGWEPFLWGVKAQAALAVGDLPRTRAHIDRAFAGTDPATTTLQFREFHETAYRLFHRLHDDKRALTHLEAYKRLDDEARDVTASTNSALLAARFDFANQELSITRLKAGQLQRDIALERSRARFNRLTLYALVAALAAAALVIVGTLFGLFSIRRSRNEVRAANDTLSVSNTALEKALKAKTEFLATTSHEIRTPLNGILGMTQVLLADRGIDRAVRDKVQVVHGAGETMRALVDDILDVAKMETGELVIADGDVDLATVLGDTARLWNGQAQAKRLALTLETADDLPRRIRGDETRLRQIVFNLMSNAIKFTDAGGVVLSAGTEARDGAELLVLRVADTGIGIAPDRHEEIFEAFKQVDGGTDRRFAGTGLGLSICRNLVAAMHGTIAVDSALGSGAVFTVRLPLVRSAEAAAPSSAARSGPPGSLSEARLLLVEANPLAQSILRAVLTPAVGTLEVASDGSEAIAVIAAGRIDLLLVEATSAAFDDHDPLAAIGVVAAAAQAAGVPVAIMFKASDTIDAASLAPLGAAALVAKPVAAPALIQTLGQLCRAPDLARSSAA